MGEPRSWGEFMEALVKLIGQAADTGGSQTAGTVFGKENAILETLRNGGMPIVKSVQRGFIEPRSVSDFEEQKITIAPVNMEKSVVICSGDGNYSNNNYNSGTNMASYARLTSSTELSYKLSYKTNYMSQEWIPNPLVWQVVEFY